jgi:hypothetical protein
MAPALPCHLLASLLLRRDRSVCCGVTVVHLNEVVSHETPARRRCVAATPLRQQQHREKVTLCATRQRRHNNSGDLKHMSNSNHSSQIGYANRGCHAN